MIGYAGRHLAHLNSRGLLGFDHTPNQTPPSYWLRKNARIVLKCQQLKIPELILNGLPHKSLKMDFAIEWLLPALRETWLEESANLKVL